MHRQLVGLYFAAVVIASPQVARATACCGSGHGLGQRLGMGEDAALTVSTRFADRFGSFDAQSRFFTTAQGIVDMDSRAELAGIVRPSTRFQVGFILPFVLNIRQFGADVPVATGSGIGDLSFQGRFDIIPLSTASGLPAVAFTTAVTLPTGRSAMDASNSLAADVTGIGVAEIRPGVFVEHSFAGRASAIFAASIGIRSEGNEPPAPRFQLAPRFRVLGAIGPVFDMGLSLSIGVFHEREAAPMIDDVAAPDSDRHRTAMLGFVGYDFRKHFTLLGSIELDMPLRHAGQNEPAYVAISIGLRRSFSWEK